MNNKLIVALLLLTGFTLMAQQGVDDASGEAVPLEVQGVLDQEEASDQGASGSEVKEGGTDAQEKPQEEEKSLFQRTLELDINTADYYQLLDWCRELGLQDSGDVNQLRSRLKQHFKVGQSNKDKEKKSSKKIVIKSADRLEYFTMSGIDEKYILLEGRVVLEIDETEEGKKSGNLYIIKANRLIMNQELRTLTAENDIEFTKINSNDKDSDPEVLNGESFTYNLDTSVGIFYYSHGSSEQEVEKNRKEAFVYYGDSISRLENDVVILEQGRITSEVSMNDPNWQIKAAKIWVLTPDEWAVQDAVIYLGRIPVFYLPFFFYPGDEMFFNPVFGYRDREGEFLNTTTYIFGEKKKSNNSFSVFRIAQDSDEGYEKVIDGLFLKKVKTTTPSKKYPENWLFKVMVDYYSRLGFFTGAKLNLDDFKLLGGLGRSRSLFPLGSSYTPFYTENGQTSSIWNHSIVNGVTLPFRFGLETDFTLKLGLTQVTGHFDLFSDPYFPPDFYNRRENKEITEYLSSVSTSTIETETTNTSTSDESDKLDATKRSTLDWYLTSSLNIGPLIDLPFFVDTLNLKKFEFKFLWDLEQDTVNQDPVKADVDPARSFYVPEEMTLPNANMSIKGTLFKFSTGARASKKTDSPDEAANFAGKGLIPPQDSQEGSFQTEDESPNETVTEPVEPFLLPDIKADQTLVKQSVLDSEVILEYDSSPYLKIDHPVNNPEDVERNNVSYTFDYSRLDTSAPLNLRFIINLLKYSVSDSIVSFENTIQMRNQYVTRFNRADDYSLADWNAGLLSDTYLNNLRFSDSVKLSLVPLYFQTPWRSSKIDYSLDVDLYRNFYETTTHFHRDEFFQWEKDYVTNHEVTALLKYTNAPFEISWNQIYDIPPMDFTLDETLNSKLTLGPSSTSIETGYIDEKKPYDFDPKNFKPLTITETLNLPPVLTLNSSIDYNFNESKWTESKTILNALATEKNAYIFKEELTADLEIPEITKFDSTISYMGLSLVLNFTKSYGYEFDPNDEQWVVDNSSEETLRFEKINLEYSWTPKTFNFWKNRISLTPEINTDWYINFLKFTDNRFNFKFSLTWTIFKFLELTFSSNSYNNNTYRYFPGLAEKVNQAELRDNVLVDLLRSFNFFNITDREQSNFKNEYFDLTIKHFLDDWTFEFSYTAKYEPIKNQNVYSPEFTLGIKWSHIPQIKNIVSVTGADDQYDYDLWDQSEENSDTEENKLE